MFRRRPFEDFARRSQLSWEEGGRVLRGAWLGQPIEVRIDATRIVIACRLESSVEASFPHSARGLLEHIREVEKGRALPTPTLRDAGVRHAWGRVLESGYVACVRGREVQIRRRRDATCEQELIASLAHVAELARRMCGAAALRRAA